MVNKILNELRNKLEEIVVISRDSYVSIGMTTNFVTMNNIVRADEINVHDDEIDVQSDNFMINLKHVSEGKITKHDYGFESEYIIKNDDMELYVSLMGT